MGLGGAILGGVIGSIIGGGWGCVIGASIGGCLSEGTAKRPGRGAAPPPVSSSNPPAGMVAFFRCLGKMAKADGIVSREEADLVQSLLKDLDGLDRNGRQVLIEAFNTGKQSSESFRSAVHKLAILCEQEMFESVMQVFCALVLADGRITAEERAMLRDAEEELNQRGYAESFFRQYGAGGGYSGSSAGGSSAGGGYAGGSSRAASERSAPSGLEEAYRTLGIPASATDEEVKSAWRKKAREFHPDKVQGKGLPEAFIAFANEQSRKINQAYETICKARGIR